MAEGDLPIRGPLVLPARELHWRFSRSSGPGGQGVNTADSRVELSFDLARSPSFPAHLRERAERRLAGRLVDGVLTVVASEHRSQLRNRDAARERLAAVLRAATRPGAARTTADAADDGCEAAPARRQGPPRSDQAPARPTDRVAALARSAGPLAGPERDIRGPERTDSRGYPGCFARGRVRTRAGHVRTRPVPGGAETVVAWHDGAPIIDRFVQEDCGGQPDQPQRGGRPARAPVDPARAGVCAAGGRANDRRPGPRRDARSCRTSYAPRSSSPKPRSQRRSARASPAACSSPSPPRSACSASSSSFSPWPSCSPSGSCGGWRSRSSSS